MYFIIYRVEMMDFMFCKRLLHCETDAGVIIYFYFS